MATLRSLVPFFILAAIYICVAMFVQNSYHQLIFTLVLVWATFGLSWNMLSGYTGLVSFGHAIFFGLGAYATCLAQIYFDISPIVMIPVSALIGALAGVLIGLPTFRLRGHYFALSMLAFPLAIYYVFEWLGYQEVTFPMKRENAALYMQFSDPRSYTLIAFALLVGVVILTRHIERTRFGMALIAIKQNEAAAEAAGIDTKAWKLRAIALSGAIAGMVGAFYSIVLLVVTPPSVFGMLVSAQALTVTMFGGVGTIWGPIIGAAFIIPVGETLHAELGSTFPGIQGVLLGVAIVLVILLAPEGVFWKVKDMLARRNAPAVRSAEVPPADIVPAATVPVTARILSDEVVLDVKGISKSFGGLKAVQNVSFQVRRGMILGIIGPNGAGKTTLFNLLNGFIRPDTGAVILKGTDMVGRMPHALCAAGVGRTFQVMRPFMRMSVADNVKVGAYVKAATEEEAVQLATEAVRRVGLTDARDQIASTLTTKELRLMELARALAGQPEILLLDETLAGLGHTEAVDLVNVIRGLAADGTTVVIIEHTMQAMVQLVDEFIVLDHGELLVQGEPLAVTRDRRVIEAYLGKKWSAHAQD
ncbi:branched-chain amino acid ABC transporter ATP-binding protein/permease [Tabrizicola sp. WMC-M-20]|nr:branched-chain amino acid ABC transporter ATP-binding protein/permease [Tabrizicola sp. WMC-M-20]